MQEQQIQRYIADRVASGRQIQEGQQPEHEQSRREESSLSTVKIAKEPEQRQR
jgi:hypothetical protein